MKVASYGDRIEKWVNYSHPSPQYMYIDKYTGKLFDTAEQVLEYLGSKGLIKTDHRTFDGIKFKDLTRRS